VHRVDRTSVRAAIHRASCRWIHDRTVAIPDRPDNNTLETLSSSLANPNVALLFVVPGHDEALRLFGKARTS
jgi:predicted pyridoxine 5'-phosphate oxidase superfamily flavin-nucleotide-binding protein